jgi:hypothetical protein
MESITFNYKTKVEQFKEQFPLLYDEIYQIAYKEAMDNQQYDFRDDYQDDDYYPEDHRNAIPTDDSERFSLSDSWEIINNKAIELQSCGYIAGNRDWVEFMESYKDCNYSMYIAWNPTHKQFAVESDRGVINQNYPHLVNVEHDI